MERLAATSNRLAALHVMSTRGGCTIDYESEVK